MHQTRSYHLLFVMQIPVDTCSSESLPILDKEEDCKDLYKPSERGHDKCIL